MHVSKKDNENCNRSGKTKHSFYHVNIIYLNKLTDKIFDLLIIHIRDYSTALITRAVAFCSKTVRCSYFICANLYSFEFKIVSD